MTDTPSSRGSAATEGSAGTLWAETFREVLDRSAHDLKGSLNGIALNLEVLRTRIASGKTEQKALEPFAEAAYQEFETATSRTEAMVFLGRPHRGEGQPDVAMTLKNLATLLVPAARADGTSLSVEGYEVSAPSKASASGVRLALAAGLLALIKEGGGTCTLETRPDTVVRFSHQSATAVNLDPEVTSALAQHGIKARRSPQDLQIVFP